MEWDSKKVDEMTQRLFSPKKSKGGEKRSSNLKDILGSDEFDIYEDDTPNPFWERGEEDDEDDDDIIEEFEDWDEDEDSENNQLSEMVMPDDSRKFTKSKKKILKRRIRKG